MKTGRLCAGVVMMLMTSFAVRGQDAQIRYLGHVGLGWLGESELD